MVYQEGHYIKINSATNKKTSAFYINFTCNLCSENYVIGYDNSRYGQIGSFSCKCGATYYVNDLDGYLSPVTVYYNSIRVAEVQPYPGD
ncbi:hypothetical protein [Neobacillus sp. YIM B06451]|uniref:hypothetical protein n=1 Tax=Neobacillus sp. YIM B06451 TaxID=3070994 RepID=UPI00292D578E|nr:hypothetical protein [Neobacillus sp. YIM B06451]